MRCPECDAYTRPGFWKQLHEPTCSRAQTKEERQAALRGWMDSMPDLVPCIYCGRIVLAGWCCKPALDDSAAIIAAKKVKR